MSNFEEEYNKRLRRVAGITDDTVEVVVESGTSEGYWDGFCDTCAYWNEGEPFVKLVQKYNGYPYRKDLVSYNDMGELIRALDNVEL